MSFIRKNFLALLIFFTATISLVLLLVLPGAYGGVGEERYYVSTIGFIFGGATMRVSTEDYVADVAMKGGVSILGLLSLILLALAVALAIMSFYRRKSRLEYYGIVLVVVSGVLMLMMFNMGTLVEINKNIIQFRSFVMFYGFELSTGAIVYGITTIVVGIIGVIIEEYNLIR